MSVNVVYNGASYIVPVNADASWGTNLTAYLTALATGSLQKTGGSFTLGAEVDFGSTYGLKAQYFKTKATVLAAAGSVRLGQAGDSINWRNNANSADNILTTDASDNLTFKGQKVGITGAIVPGDFASGFVLPANLGGTGVANNALSTITVSGAYGTTFTVTAATAITLPISGTLATLSNVETLTNKTLSGNIATNLVSGAATITLPTTTGTLATLANAETLTNKTLSTGTSITAGKITTAVAEVDPADNTKQWNATLSGATTATATTFAFAQTANRTLTMPDATDTLVGRATTDTLTNKTLTAPVQSSYEDFTEVSTPANPGAGKLRVYAKTDDKFYTLTSAGVETALGAGAGGGSGELNLVGSPSTAANWSNTGTTGAGANAPATTSTAGDLPLSGIVSTAIKITSGTSAGAEASNYTSYAFTTPASYAVKTKVEFWMRPGTNFVASEWTVSVYAGSTRQALTTDASGVTYLPNGLGKFTAYFDAVASTAYTLRFARVTNAGANAGVLNVANVIVGPGIQPQGAVASAPITYVPASAGFGTVSSVTFTWEQVASRCRVVGEFVAGTPTATAASLTLPNNWTASTPGSTTIIIGKWERYSATGSQVKTGTIIANAGSNTVNFSTDDTSTSLNPFVSQNGSSLFFASDIISVDFSVQINQLAGSGTVNLAQNDAQYQYSTDGATTAGAVGSTANTAYGPNGTLINSIASTTTTSNSTTDFPITMQPALQAGETTQVEVNQGFGWVPANFLVPYLDQGTARYGIRLEVNSATQVTVRFGNAGSIPSSGTYGSAGSAWSTLNGAGWKWRIKRVVGGQAIGFSTVSATSSGLMPSTNANLDDSTATRLGFKQYYHGTNYNGGNAPTLTCGQAGYSVIRALFIPYQMQDGSWRMRFNTVASITSATITSLTQALAGATFKNVSNFLQPISAILNGTGSGSLQVAFVSPNTGNLSVGFTSNTGTTSVNLSGDVELDSKPTWAY